MSRARQVFTSEGKGGPQDLLFLCDRLWGVYSLEPSLQVSVGAVQGESPMLQSESVDALMSRMRKINPHHPVVAPVGP
jgi:hypothetical protein